MPRNKQTICKKSVYTKKNGTVDKRCSAIKTNLIRAKKKTDGIDMRYKLAKKLVNGNKKK